MEVDERGNKIHRNQYGSFVFLGEEEKDERMAKKDTIDMGKRGWKNLSTEERRERQAKTLLLAEAGMQQKDIGAELGVCQQQISYDMSKIFEEPRPVIKVLQGERGEEIHEDVRRRKEAFIKKLGGMIELAAERCEEALGDIRTSKQSFDLARTLGTLIDKERLLTGRSTQITSLNFEKATGLSPEQLDQELEKVQADIKKRVA